MQMFGRCVVCLLLRLTEFLQRYLQKENLSNTAKVVIGHINCNKNSFPGKEALQMHESPIFILKRIDSRHFSKLWLF